MRKAYFFIATIATIIIGCSSDEPGLSDEQTPTSENIYLEFNKWVYAQMNKQYLWRNDLPDSLECNYDLAPRDFFKSLLSPKDRFSYFASNPSYNGSSSKNLGFAYQRVRDKKDNEALQVLYVTSDNAKRAGLKRGDYVNVVSEDACKIILNRISLNDGSFSERCDYLEFTVDNILGSNSSVLLDSIYEINNKKVGYLCYLEYDGVRDLYKPILKFSENQVSELILDLRYNPGGYVSTCRYLCNCIVPISGYGNIFQQCSYNDVLSEQYKNTTGNERTFSYFDFPTPSDKEILGTSLVGLQLKEVYVLTSKHTASASEATIVCLKPYMDVITIGETTVGKGVGSWNISDPKYQYSIQPITMRYYNAKSESTPDDGIVPDIYIPDGYTVSKKEIGDVSETLLNAALSLILNQSNTKAKAVKDNQFETSLTLIGEPSYVTEFKTKHYNENN
jgi:hypothetical protein